MEMEQKRTGGAYFDPNFDAQIDELQAPRVCIDNDTYEDCTLVKVDSANRHGILLEMVQLLTDIDLVISKSSISSDGGWFYDVFHVTNQLGDKLTEKTLIEYIKQWLVKGPRASGIREVRTCLGKLVGTDYLAAEQTVLEITATDRPGLLSEITAVLVELGCHVVCMHAWTHNAYAAAILYLTDSSIGHHSIINPDRLAEIERQVDIVVGAHQVPGETRRITVTGPVPFRVHTERRLHQLLHEVRDYEAGPAPSPVDSTQFGVAVVSGKRVVPSSTEMETRVSIENWNEKEYSVVTILSKDRPKLLFDTVCTLTDMQYAVFHASVSSHGGVATQEYYIRHIDGYLVDTETERQRVSRCLAAAVHRRVSPGVRIDMYTKHRHSLLADVTRVYRENGLSLKTAEYATRGEKMVGAFYVADMSVGDVDPKTVDAVRAEIGGSVTLKVNSSMPGWPPLKKIATSPPRLATAASNGMRVLEEERPRFSLGSLLWSQIGRISGNIGIIRS